MRTIKGDLVNMAKLGYFDVIAHCDCFCNMDADIAKTIKERIPRRI